MARPATAARLGAPTAGQHRADIGLAATGLSVLGWPLLALLAWSQLDWLMLARTSALAFGYLNGTGARLPGGLRWLQPVAREAIPPTALLTCLILLIRAVLPARVSGPMES